MRQRLLPIALVTLLLSGCAANPVSGTPTTPNVKVESPPSASTASPTPHRVGSENIDYLNEPAPISPNKTSENQRDWITGATFADENHGWLTLNNRIILATQDSGEHWEQVYESKHELGDVQFASAKVGWSMSSVGLLATDDGGRSWRPISTQIPPMDRLGLADGQPTWARGRGILYLSSNGGQKWIPVPTPCGESGVGAFSFISRQTGWIICIGADTGMGRMDKTLYKTTDAGKNWTLIASGGKHEKDETLPGGYLGDLFFLDDTHGWYSEVRHGGLYATSDGGRTWNRLEGLNGQAVTFIRFTASGFGSVLHMDAGPFRLKTTSDDGKTWVERFPKRTESP